MLEETTFKKLSRVFGRGSARPALKFCVNCALLFIFFLIGFILINQPSRNSKLEYKPENINYVKIAAQTIKVDLAVTSQEQAQGLSGRIKLKENEGMLFIFDQSGTYRFWMKDMKFPIDIIWINKDLKVVYIKKDAEPQSYPKTYGSGKDALYILEVASSFSNKNKLKEGDRVEFLY